MERRTKSEGFPGQIIHFSPESLRKELARHPLGQGLQLVHAGWFPKASRHFRERPEGSDEAIVIYCTAGRGWYEINHVRHALQPSQALLIPANTPHSYGADDKDPWSIYWAHFSGTSAPAYCALLRRGAYSVRIWKSDASEVKSLFRRTCDAFLQGMTLQRVLLASHILRHILGVLFVQGTKSRASAPRPAGQDMTDIIGFLRANVNRPLSLGEISRQAGLSPSRFSDLFRERTGLSPVEHHIRLRIQAACHLLDTTRLTVKEAAAHMGYEDPYYFSRIFRKITGVSPTAYRRSKKG